MERQKIVLPGSPWRPARPRSWLSTLRLSCSAVPMTCNPPISRTSEASLSHCVSQSPKTSIAARRNRFTTGFGAPCFFSCSLAANSAAAFTAPPRPTFSAYSTAPLISSKTLSGSTGRALSASATTRAIPTAALAAASDFELKVTCAIGSGCDRKIASSDPGESRGNSNRARYERHNPTGLPPNTISVPRPAMFVAMVTALARPAWLTISASFAAKRGRAFRSLCGTPVTNVPSCARHRYSLSILDRTSEFSTLVVPTKTGRPSQ
mmetsp:Transcript_2286/g.8793  ORF Transcript_2286/g.8793 Transcript_2286/m.8793 type:complete len:265 (+) Transcript_2286:1408-2202(+)